MGLIAVRESFYQRYGLGWHTLAKILAFIRIHCPARPDDHVPRMQVPQPRKPRQQPIARFVRGRFANNPAGHRPTQPRHVLHPIANGHVAGDAAPQPDFGRRDARRPAFDAHGPQPPDIAAFSAAGQAGEPTAVGWRSPVL